MWKTQPPKSPLSGGLSTQFPPDKGARGVKNDERWVSCTVSYETVQETLDRHAMWKTQPPKSPLSGGLVTQFPPDKGGKGG